jgi:hypothetical protein
MAIERKRLSEILSEGQRKSYFADWQTVKAAGDFIIPKGEYVALLIDGYAHTAKTGTAGFKLVFEIAEGEHAGRKVFHDLWLTEAAKPQTKRDLDELGITDPERQLDGPVPQGIVVALTITVQKDDDGLERNRVRRIKFLRVEPGGDAFAPKEGEAVDTSFDPATFDKPEEPPANGEQLRQTPVTDSPSTTGGALFPTSPNSGPYGGDRP